MNFVDSDPLELDLSFPLTLEPLTPFNPVLPFSLTCRCVLPANSLLAGSARANDSNPMISTMSANLTIVAVNEESIIIVSLILLSLKVEEFLLLHVEIDLRSGGEECTYYV
jgi:hypothetical protein